MFFSRIYIKYNDPELNDKSTKISNYMNKTSMTNINKIIYGRYLYYYLHYDCHYDPDIMKKIASILKNYN